MGEICRSCGAQILWAKTKTGKRTPLDAKPVRVATLVEDPETGKEIVEEGLFIELNADYCDMARRRIDAEASQHAKVAL